MQRLKVGILVGGKSIEREVSLNSGRTVCDHLDTSRYDVVPIFQTSEGILYLLPWRFLHRGKIADFEHRLEKEAQRISWDSLKQLVDFVYIAFHGRFGEDGCVQGFLEVLTIPYFGSKVLASALGMNKPMQKIVLNAAGIRIPKGFVMAPHEIDEEVAHQKMLLERIAKANLVFPLIVKPGHEGSSLGVTRVASIEELAPALLKATAIHEHKRQQVLVEELITGMEFSCIVITDYQTGQLVALPPTEIIIEKAASIFDYDQKYMPGRATKHTPARCSTETTTAIQQISVRVMNALGFSNLGRIDGFVMPDGTICITDPNSFSGMAPSSYAFLQAAEINMTHTGLINHLIETELEAYGMLNSLPHSSHQFNNKPGETDSRIRVGVLLGGSSNEREISLESGRNVCYKLSPQQYAVTPLFVSSTNELHIISQRLLVQNATQEIEELVDTTKPLEWDKLPALFDFIFIGLHGGIGENGSVQGTLEMLGLPYNGSPVLTSALCMDKYRTNELLNAHGIAIPHHALIAHKEWQQTTNKTCPLTFPVVVKPHDDGCSVLVQKADNQSEFEKAVACIFAGNKTHALVEEFIIGTEVTIGVIGNDRPLALPPSQSIAAKGILSIEEKFLPGAGENQTPALLPDAALQLIQKTAEQVFVALGCKGYVRIDCFYQDAQQSPTGEERVVIIEPNTLPGLTPATCLFHQAAEIGIKPMDFVDLIVQLGFEYHTQQPHLSPAQRQLLKHEKSADI